MQIFHEAIYRCLFIQSREVLKKEFMAHWRNRAVSARPKPTTVPSQALARVTCLPVR